MLKWNGKGTIEGVPARDLSEAEVRWYGGEAWLVKSGFYERAQPAAPLQPGEGRKAVYGGRENK